MDIRDRIVATARECIGTPYVHQGRVKGVGIDCAGLIIVVARELGLVAPDFDIDGYGRRSEGVEMLELFREFCGEGFHAGQFAGDILMFQKGDWRHCGILAVRDCRLTVIHTHGAARACVEHEIDDYWRSLYLTTFRFPGVSEFPTLAESESLCS
jgi:cell wall-associated NlpC family hydrolase